MKPGDQVVVPFTVGLHKEIGSSVRSGTFHDRTGLVIACVNAASDLSGTADTWVYILLAEGGLGWAKAKDVRPPCRET